MINLTKSFLWILILGVAFILFACAGEDDGSEEVPQALIVGTWEVPADGGTIEVNDEVTPDFASAIAECLQEQGRSETAQDIIDDIDGVSIQVADNGDLLLFGEQTRFTFNSDSTYTFQGSNGTSEGSWRLVGDELTLDEDQRLVFTTTISSDQLTLTDVYQLPESIFTQSYYSLCTDRLTIEATTQLNRVQ